MPLQTLDLGPVPGASVASGFGAGLGSGLEQLANLKMQQYAQRQQSARTQSALEQYGIPQQTAQAVSQMDPAMQQAYFKNYLQAPQNEAYANAWQQILGDGQQAPQPQTGMQALSQQAGMPVQQQAGISSIPNSGVQQPVMPNLKGLSKEQIEKLGPLALQKQQFEKKQASQMSAQDWKKAQYYDKRSEPEYEKAKGKAEAADENSMRFDRMKELIMNKNLPTPAWANSFDSISHGIFGLGLNMNSLLGADAEEFRKLSADMMKNIKDIFGARVTNIDVENFLKTIPTLSNTDEGKLRIIHNLELFNKANTSKYKIMNDIMEENDGMRPRNFDQLVEKRYRPAQEQIAKEFSKGVRKDYAENPFRPLTKKEKKLVDRSKEILNARIEGMLESTF